MFKVLIYKVKKALLPGLLTSGDMINYLKNAGVSVGNGTIFYGPSRTIVDISRPCLLSIGAYCKITSGVTILTHDYSRSVLRRVYGEIIGEAAETSIGNNVFIGMNSIILMGSKIGNNVIIGAGSIVKGEFPDNVVVAGNPARIICTLDVFYHNRKNIYVSEAKAYAELFFKKNKRKPTIKEMDPFYPIFLPRELKLIEDNQLTIKLGGDNYHETVEAFLKSKPLYSSYEEFLNDCSFCK